MLAKSFGQARACVQELDYFDTPLTRVAWPVATPPRSLVPFLAPPGVSLLGSPHSLLTQSKVLQLPAVGVHGPATLHLCAKASRHVHPNPSQLQLQTTYSLDDSGLSICV